MISPTELQELNDAGIISFAQINQIMQFQQSGQLNGNNGLSSVSTHKLNLSKVIFYLGGFLIFFGISYGLGANWPNMSDNLRFFITTLLFATTFITGLIAQKKQMQSLASMFFAISTITFFVWMISIEGLLAFLPDLDNYEYEFTQSFLSYGTWTVIYFITLIYSLALFFYSRNPLLTVPVSVLFWNFGYNAGFAILRYSVSLSDSDFKYEPWITSLWSLACGAILVLWGINLHRKESNSARNFPWFLGLLVMLAGFVTLQLNKLIYLPLLLLIFIFYSIFLLILAIPLRSRIFLLYGALCFWLALIDISVMYFARSVNFYVLLAVIGVATVILGLFLQKLQKKIA